MDSNRLDQLAALLARHQRVALVEGPTPVRRLSRAFPAAPVWLKDDSASNPVYGGNKPRKLEYLIARARARGHGVVTFGFESSNHAVATAVHCKSHGVACHLVLVRGPSGLSEAELRLKDLKLEIVNRLAASIETVDDFPKATRVGLWRLLTGLGRLRLIPPGGSNALGTLGYVGGALELARQIERKELPVPRTIFVPLGTGGTALGIALGLAACGLKTRVVAVKVVPGPVNELPRLRLLARQVARLLPGLPREVFSLSNLELEPGELGAGYGQATAAGQAAVERWAATESVRLETTYSGKAAAALERRVHEGRIEGPALFWLTYSECRSSSSE